MPTSSTSLLRGGSARPFNVAELAMYLAPPAHDQPSDPGPFSTSEFADQYTPTVLPLDWHDHVEEVLQEVIDFAKEFFPTLAGIFGRG